MGHERIGYLPRTASWRNIVQSLEAATIGDDEAKVTGVAAKTLELVRDRFLNLHRDSGVQAAFGFLVAVARAAGPSAETRAAPHIQLPSESTPLRLAVAANQWIDSNAQSREYAELSKRAAAEAIATWHRRQSGQEDLFAQSPSELSRQVWASASTGAGFSEISRLFFSSLTERYLRYFLEREASAAITSIEARERFSESLHQSIDNISHHAFETSKIAQSFAAGWFNKHAQSQTPSNALLSNFLRVAFGKIREELKREASR